MLRYFSLSLLLLVLTACGDSISSASGGAVTPSPVSEAVPQSSTSADPSVDGQGVTYDKFLAISYGDSLETVQGMLGMEGEWSGGDDSVGVSYAFPTNEADATPEVPSISVQFDSDGGVLSKTQQRLMAFQGNVSPEQFAQIKIDGTTLGEVEEIFGSVGILTAEYGVVKTSPDFSDPEVNPTLIYKFMGADNTVVLVVVNGNGVVIDKEQHDAQSPSQSGL